MSIRQQSIYNPLWREYRGIDITLDEFQQRRPIGIERSNPRVSVWFATLGEAQAYIDQHYAELQPS